LGHYCQAQALVSNLQDVVVVIVVAVAVVVVFQSYCWLFIE